MGSDLGPCAPFPVGERRGNKELPLRSLFHQLESLGPARNHTIHRKTDGLPTTVRAVQFGSINQRTLVVSGHGIGRFWFFPTALLHHLILQAAGQSHNLLLLLVPDKKGFSLLLIHLSCFFHHLLLFGLHLLLECGDRVLHLFLCQ